MLADDQNKDAIDELVLMFGEKVEENVRIRENQITKSRDNEWKNITQSMLDNQHMRGRQIISEIISTT